MEKLRTIRLYGPLGTRFGREFRLAVSSPAEAVRALCVLLPGFASYLTHAKDRGMAFAVFVGRRNLGLEQLHDPPGTEDIRIAPVLMGAKSSAITTILIGAALIITAGAASVYLGGTFLGTAAVGGVVGAAGAAGWAMVVGGIAQMLAPQPKGLGTGERPENKPSYSFNGPVNTQAQGSPYPLGYGRGWGGGAIISAGIYTEDQA
ncbi:tail assembly protein [Xanthomonas translucens pv. graminis]|uniref:tail assembly protein n=1 Tax=Xanthomonas graminis TaxID=3390026 RepID=UPI002540DA38|nr:tail assembly protein [Xanthomonas translucens]WIH05509.1 tail assembly protein [Xanthomonas translucens pv. graminis]